MAQTLRKSESHIPRVEEASKAENTPRSGAKDRAFYRDVSILGLLVFTAYWLPFYYIIKSGTLFGSGINVIPWFVVVLAATVMSLRVYRKYSDRSYHL